MIEVMGLKEFFEKINMSRRKKPDWSIEDLKSQQRIYGDLYQFYEKRTPIKDRAQSFIDEIHQKYPIVLYFLGTHSGKKEYALEVVDKRENLGLIEKVENVGFIWDEIDWESIAQKHGVQIDLDDVSGDYLRSYKGHRAIKHARENPNDLFLVLFIKP